MTITKEQIDRFIILQQQTNEINNDIHYDIIMICNQIYATFESNKPTDYSYSINDHEVNVRWSETWRYGGYDSGFFTFPTECLYNEDALKNHINGIKQKQDNEKRIAKEKDIEDKKLLYEKLKVELENKYYNTI